MPRNPTLFNITVPITKKIMDRAIEVSTNELEDYAPEHFRAAGISAKKIRANLANDTKFCDELSRQMVDACREAIMDRLDFSEISVSTHPTIKNAIKLLDRAVQAEEQRMQQDYRSQRIKDATALLREAGFKVIKA